MPVLPKAKSAAHSGASDNILATNIIDHVYGIYTHTCTLYVCILPAALAVGATVHVASAANQNDS